MRTIFCIAIGYLMLFVAGYVSAREKDINIYDNIYEKRGADHGWIEPGYAAGSPCGKLLLIRKGKDACGIRFTGYHRDYDRKQETFFSTGEENMYGEYEWYYQGDGSYDFTRGNVASGKGKLHRGPAYRLGHMLTLWRTPPWWWIECGPFKLEWSYPCGLTIRSYVEATKPKLDEEVELAPTKWTKLEEVDFANPKLKWVKDQRIVIGVPQIEWLPLEELP
jgi:hypothetical protein